MSEAKKTEEVFNPNSNFVNKDAVGRIGQSPGSNFIAKTLLSTLSPFAQRIWDFVHNIPENYPPFREKDPEDE